MMAMASLRHTLLFRLAPQSGDASAIWESRWRPVHPMCIKSCYKQTLIKSCYKQTLNRRCPRNLEICSDATAQKPGRNLPLARKRQIDLNALRTVRSPWILTQGLGLMRMLDLLIVLVEKFDEVLHVGGCRQVRKYTRGAGPKHGYQLLRSHVPCGLLPEPRHHRQN